MATKTIRPDGDSVVTDWTTAPLFSKVNDQSDAAFITTIEMSTVGTILTFPTPSIVPSSVTSISLDVRLLASSPSSTVEFKVTGGIEDPGSPPDGLELFLFGLTEVFQSEGVIAAVPAAIVLDDDLSNIVIELIATPGSEASVDISQIALTFTFDNQRPTTPGAFSAPLSGEVYRDELIVSWGPSTDPEGDAIQYEGEYSSDAGGSWTSLFSLQGGLSYTWDISGFTEGTQYQVRVRAHDGTDYSAAYKESDVFYISTPQCDAGTPDVSGGCTA